MFCLHDIHIFIFQSMHVQGQYPRASVVKFTTKDEDGIPFRIAIPSQVAEEHAAANPIRNVVTMLQTMQKKVEAEGEREQELFD